MVKVLARGPFGLFVAVTGATAATAVYVHWAQKRDRMEMRKIIMKEIEYEKQQQQQQQQQQ